MAGRVTWDNQEEKDKHRQIRAEVRKRRVYKHLNRRKFITPKGYRDYDDVIMTIALNMELAELGLDLAGHRWIWLCAIDVFGRAAVENTFPVYTVDRELLTVLLEAEEPKQFGKILPTPIETGLFLFPQGMIRVGHWSVDWMLVDTVDQGDRVQEFCFEKEAVLFERLSDEDRRRYRWVTQTESSGANHPGDMFVSTFGYSEQGEELEKRHISISQDDIDLTSVLTALSKHLWLWLYQPKEYEYIDATRSRGFSQKANDRPKAPRARYPIKLGIEDQPHRIYKYDRDSNTATGKRKSPVKHERRAHWRNVPIGSRKEAKRELRLIAKTTIKPENEL